MKDWFRTDLYEGEQAMPATLANAPTGPRGWGLVNVFGEGRTTPGWGDAFMPNYLGRRFVSGTRVHQFNERRKPFALVMRSAAVICLDLDNHVGGVDGLHSAAKLDLPPTCAETSRSGAGRHLFYRMPHEWSDSGGFDVYTDMIGLKPGVDVRAVGCVYHYSEQRWNLRELAFAPDHLIDLLDEHMAKKVDTKQYVQDIAQRAAAGTDDEEVLLMHDALQSELAQPIPNGRRNQTLFAIGSKLRAAGVPQWDTLVADRAQEIGLGHEEAEKIVGNIGKYNP